MDRPGEVQTLPCGWPQNHPPQALMLRWGLWKGHSRWGVRLICAVGGGAWSEEVTCRGVFLSPASFPPPPGFSAVPFCCASQPRSSSQWTDTLETVIQKNISSSKLWLAGILSQECKADGHSQPYPPAQFAHSSVSHNLRCLLSSAPC